MSLDGRRAGGGDLRLCIFCAEVLPREQIGPILKDSRMCVVSPPTGCFLISFENKPE